MSNQVVIPLDCPHTEPAARQNLPADRQREYEFSVYFDGRWQTADVIAGSLDAAMKIIKGNFAGDEEIKLTDWRMV